MRKNKKAIIFFASWIWNCLLFIAWAFFPFGGIGYVLERIHDGFYHIGSHLVIAPFTAIVVKIDQTIAIVYFLSTILGSFIGFLYFISKPLPVRIVRWCMIVNLTLFLSGIIVGFVLRLSRA